MARRGRAAASRAAVAIRNTPQVYTPEDDTMADNVNSDAGTPPNDEDEDDVSGDDNEDEDENDNDNENDNDIDDATPAPDEDAGSNPATPQPGARTSRRGRPGRPRGGRAPVWKGSLDEDDEGSTERGTPKQRGRRGGWRGGTRWPAKKGGPSHVTQQPIDKEGNMIDVINDELELPEDAEGEKKVDKMGALQDGREYRCRTFKVKGRGDRLYMLSTEPARCVGFRDSYLFFAKHKKLFKIIVEDEEKRDMIERALIPHSYKGRAIGIVTARSVFREFGAQIIVGGRRITDDYEVARWRAEGAVEGELADPNDAIQSGQSYNKNQYVAWHGASAVYHTGQPTVPTAETRKRKAVVTDVNWKYQHALDASTYNARLGAIRRMNLSGVYDIHTNNMLFPKHMQPTHVRYEPVFVEVKTPNIGNLALEDGAISTTSGQSETIFPPIKPEHAKEFLILDTVYENAPHSHFGQPGDNHAPTDMGFNGISAIPEDVKDLLDPELRASFDDTLRQEQEWKVRWQNEERDLHRRPLHIILKHEEWR